MNLMNVIRYCEWQNMDLWSGVSVPTGINREALQSQAFEVLGEETGEVGPFGIVTRQENCLVTEGVRVVLQISVDLLLNVRILGVELVILGSLSGAKIRIVGHKLRFSWHLRLILTRTLQGTK